MRRCRATEWRCTRRRERFGSRARWRSCHSASGKTGSHVARCSSPRCCRSPASRGDLSAWESAADVQGSVRRGQAAAGPVPGDRPQALAVEEARRRLAQQLGLLRHDRHAVAGVAARPPTAAVRPTTLGVSALPAPQPAADRGALVLRERASTWRISRPTSVVASKLSVTEAYATPRRSRGRGSR